jgi:hypothetical protein
MRLISWTLQSGSEQMDMDGHAKTCGMDILWICSKDMHVHAA